MGDVKTRVTDPILWTDVLQLVKTAAAAVIAWVLAVEVLSLPQSFLAPWAALLTVHATFMKSFAAEPIWGEVSMKEYDVLYALTKAEAPVRLTDLHRRVLLSQPALSA